MKKLANKKLNGYSIPFAILVFVVVIILSGSITLATYENNTVINRFFIMEKMDSNAMSALNIMIAHTNDFPYHQTQSFSLFGENMDSVSTYKERWGAFDIIKANASCRGIRRSHSALIGSYRYDSSAVTLFIPDAGKSIALVGNVNINGRCELPESKFSQPSIEGRNFTGNTNRVNAITSKDRLPSLTPRLADLKGDNLIPEALRNHVVTYYEWTSDTLAGSFLSDTTTTLYANDPILLDRKCLMGKVMIVSERSITIQASTTLSDVICFAPYIHIMKGFSGNCQLYASDSIIIEENCLLKYPSVVGINNDKADNPTALTIKKDCHLDGVAFLHSQSDNGCQNILHIETGATVNGQVYSNRYTEIKGTINGSLYTNKLILRTPSSIYENTIMDANIDLAKLSKNYVGVDIIDEGSSGGVIKWLH